MKPFPHPIRLLLLAAVLSLGSLGGTVRAAVQAQAGAYRVELETDPGIVPVGKAQLRLQVLDASGQPVTGATVKTLTKMPGMAMGEREETARPQPDKPGLYIAPAAFPMGGGYTVDLKISGARGQASGTLNLQTGQSTASGASKPNWLLPIGLLLLVTFIAWRMRRTGQKLHWRALVQWQTAAGIAILLAMLFGARYAVNHLRRPGSMTPLEAQGMEMNMPAPEGTTAVELATVQLKPLRSTVRYTGQAVGFVEQQVYPRVAGQLLWMPLYVGDTVKRGQLLARLDTSQIEPQIAQQRAAQRMAEQGARSAQSQYRQAQGAITQAEAELGSKQGALAEARSQERKARAEIGSRLALLSEARSQERKARSSEGGSQGAVEEARAGQARAQAVLRETNTALRSSRGAASEAQSDLAAANEDKSNAQAERDAAQSQVTNAQAELTSAQADLDYWAKEIARMQVLVKEGAVSREEFQREQAQAESSRAKVRQAQARVVQAGAGVRGAQSRIRRAEAMIRSAQAKAQQAQATTEGSQARIEQAQSDIVSARAKVSQAQAQSQGALSDISGAGARIRQMEEDVRVARAEADAAGARVQQAQSELEAHHAHVLQIEEAAQAARSGVGQARAGVEQAQASVTGATTARGYAEIRSLIDGVVTQRLISPGTLVQPGQAILQVAQVSPIRLQASVAEADLQRVRVGTPVTVRDRDGKEQPVTAHVTSVAPSVDSQTRTGLVEAVLPNTDRRFRPGAYVVLEITVGQSTSPLSVPTSAVLQRPEVQAGQASSYVWVAQAGQGSQLTVRAVTVHTGVSDGKQVEILKGLEPGQRVVTVGAQNLSEGDTVSAPSNTLMAQAPTSPPTSTSARASTPAAQISVTERGFEPASVSFTAGAAVRLTFTRKTDATCAKEVAFPDYNIKKALPLNQPVTIEFTPRRSGPLNYVCGMNMFRGQVIVR